MTDAPKLNLTKTRNRKEICVASGIRGLIFDCDGTLADTMPLHMQAWAAAFREVGEDYPGDFLYHLKGMKEEEIVRLYNRRFRKELDARKLVEAKHRYFRRHLASVRPIAPVVAVAWDHHGRLPMGVVSGGTRRNVLRTLEIIGISELFDVILTADDRIRPKPAPDIFIAAARALGVNPRVCQVFEDGDIGLEAARHAGMTATDVRPFLEGYLDNRSKTPILKSRRSGRILGKKNPAKSGRD